MIRSKNFKDLTGQKFNHLTAIKLDEIRMLEYKIKHNKSKTFWLCECDCGNNELKSVAQGALCNGTIKSCGCKHILSLEGKRFGKLTVLSYAYSKDGHTYWNCHCDCGNDVITIGTRLNKGNTKSCGCYNAESKTTHGLSNHPLYAVYSTMKQRCYNPNSKDYYLYGGKGIIICKEWLKEDNCFLNFYNWAMDNGYEKGLEIDRIDSNKNYEPNNCRWVDDIRQANNTSKNMILEINNKKMTFSDWCRYYKVENDKNTIWGRIHRGWNIEEAFETPVDGEAHYKKDSLLEYKGEFYTLKELCDKYDRNYGTVSNRISRIGWDLETALKIPTDGKKHIYEKERGVH